MNERQEIPLIRDPDHGDDIAQMIALFDVVYASRVHVNIWSHEHPGAEYALMLFAGAKNLKLFKMTKGTAEQVVTWTDCSDVTGRPMITLFHTQAGVL